MSWITVIWSMIASASLTLAAIHFMVWGKKRTAWAHLLFSLMAVSTSALAGCELWMMRAETIGQFATALRWLHVPAWGMIVIMVGFVRLYLRAGRPWLGWTVCALRTLSLLLDFLVGQNLNYREITRLLHIPFLGDSVSAAEGVSNPWMLVGQLSLVLWVVFVADATITVWRRGDRRAAMAVGGSIVFFTLAATVQAVLVLWEIVRGPITASFFYMGIVAVMAHEMSREAIRAAQLSDDLRESEERMTLAAEAAGFGVWMWSIARNQVWGSERWLRLFGFAPGTAISYDEVIQRIHPDDREIVEIEVKRALMDRADYSGEYRVILSDGTLRWISARGRVFPDAKGNPVRMLGAATDITYRKKSEAALKESEERFHQVAEIAGEFIWEVDAKGLYTYASPSVALILGYIPEELVGKKHFYDLFEPSMHEARKVAAFQVFAERQTFRDFPNPNVSKSGKIVHLETSGSPVLDKAGNLIGYRGADTDVSARLKAQAVLQQSEQKFRRLYESMMDAFVIVDMAGRIQECNPAYQELLGYSEDELRRMPYQDLTPKQWHEFEARILGDQFMRRGYTAVYEKEYRKKDGTVFPVDLHTFLIRNESGRPAGMWAIVRDITERKRAEQALRESAERLRQAAEAAEFGVYQHDLARGEAFYSSEFLALYGLPDDATLALDSDMVAKALHPDDKARFLACMQSANDPAGPGIFDVEYRIFRPDGQVRWLRARGRSVFAGQGPDNRPLRASGIIQDITVRKQSEQEIEQQRNELAHLSRVHMLGELASSLAHELNQPLTAILSNAQAAQRFLAHDPVNLKEIRDILADIVAEDKRAGEVIRRLRLLLKKGEVHQQPISMNKVVGEVLKLVYSDLVNQGVTMQTDLAPDLPILRGDRVQLQQVLLNLVMNACDAMAAAAPLDRRITICTGRAGDGCVLTSIADRGAGIAPEKLDRVFESYYTTKPHGMGFGLTVCRTIIAAHGGKLWATNNPERGATFHFTLPVSGEVIRDRLSPIPDH